MLKDVLKKIELAKFAQKIRTFEHQRWQDCFYDHFSLYFFGKLKLFFKFTQKDSLKVSFRSTKPIPFLFQMFPDFF